MQLSGSSGSMACVMWTTICTTSSHSVQQALMSVPSPSKPSRGSATFWASRWQLRRWRVQLPGSSLGIEIDTVAGTLSLPYDYLTCLQTLLREWLRRRSCTRRQLESLIGTLQHACKVIRPGRAFLRQMIALLPVTKKPYCLNNRFRAVVAMPGKALEWCIHHTNSTTSHSVRDVRCIWTLELWSLVEPGLVPVPVA